MKTIILDIGDESADWIKRFNTRIKKAKVYVKNPSDVPQGISVERGKRGGYYYESSGQSSEESEESDRTQEEEKLKRSTGMFNVDGVIIQFPPNDIPTNAVQKINACADSFRFSSLKKKTVIIFTGKSAHKKFMWQDRNGKEHQSEYGGDASYMENVIHLWDDFNVDTIIYHEVGHFVYYNMFNEKLSLAGKIDDALGGFESISDINKYHKMVEILKNHNVEITPKTIDGILDNIDYARELGILNDMKQNGLDYYDEGYNTLFAMRERTKSGYIPELNLQDVKQWKKYRTTLKNENKSNKLRNEWHKIWEEEGYPQNEYANRNNSETFAEFYQSMDRWLRAYENLVKNENPDPTIVFSRAQESHPRKLEFFRKYVMKKYIPKLPKDFKHDIYNIPKSI